MYIEQAYSKKYDFIKYLPIPILFFLLILLNFVAILLLDIDTEALMKQQIEQSSENAVFLQSVAPLAFFLVMLLVWVKFVNKQSIKSLTTARKKVDWGRIFFSFGLWSLITVATTLLAYFSEPQNFEFNFQPVPFAILFVMAIVLIPMQTSFEEYLFRGYLMQGLGIATRSRLFPLVFTSLMFGLMHIANPEVGKMGYLLLLYYVGTGFFLGITTLMDDGMELSLGFHAANNLIGCLLVTQDYSALQTPSILKDISEPSAGYDILLPVVIIYPILLFIFAKKYKWTNWKEKLTGKIVLPKQDVTIDAIGHE
ncbi:CPBP family intramembrane glutamic endopeptidase [Flavobacterium subsaxonicum]|uniref:CAAX protease n=1 Tax=Flavobacterium subsaxonicum WB 4.1-42 = DSM 21790 TaxID=1121898 RepID=A0A0A2MPS9_9FLAO|nr:CPBP family intramembrane glutamic endopeptidase [Flavobacterium subsaxonicum]KGO93581.1 CAAX protease [Flavobacterium subsaxonicum WB 4.1-42 = DSM 21790]